MTTADELRTRLLTDLRVAYAVTQADRPDGLTASRIAGCSSAAARLLLNQPQGTDGLVYPAFRGTAVHDAFNDMLALIDPGFTDGRGSRYTWSPGEGLPDITGEFDLMLDDAVGEVKTRPKTECRWHVDHGADPQHAVQASIAAAALGKTEAYVIYLPTDGDETEIAVCPVDVPHWVREATAWLHQVDVRGEVEDSVSRGVPRTEAVRRVLDVVPREPHPRWCRSFCRFAQVCRGDYEPPPDWEITDPTLRAAAEEAEHWRQVRLAAGRREEAAKSRLSHVEGVAHVGDDVIRVAQQQVPAMPSRRAHRKMTVDRRPS